ncbi:hypothetical protein A1O3_04008 [Capronia epimyces CBS 606.96]|uniref:Uncharacterized protein n=1 Tax=Capronia epimyces CBS 606.96 TaxID=1182542 RepID=W9YCS5_9EURO|nr:uncharacterized protein A1O3_04008 [Capronia epimyces CBS 606.96]EXJ87051.1 hypothetical protein A1O3_04008 [Capronia epimyces CBS 606.96]
MLQSNGMISPVTPSLTPKPENSIRQQPIIFPLTPPSTAKYPRAGAPAKLSTIAECSTEDEKTPQSCRISPDRDFALTPTPTPTRIMAMMEEEKKGRVALYKEQVTQAKLRRERAKKGT